MTLPLETLDDRRFEDLFEEARALLPRLAPEWSEYNASDPGITLVELFAWLCDTQFQRLDQVPERQREAFARLLGLERREASPARVVLWRADRAAVGHGLLPAGTPVWLDERRQLPFETARDTWLTGARIERVRTIVNGPDGATIDEHDLTHELEPTRFLPFGSRPRAGDALELVLVHGGARGRGEPALPSTLASLWFEVADEDLPPPGVEDGCAPPPRSSAHLAWEWSPTGVTWQPLDIVVDDTRGLARDGSVVFRSPDPSSVRVHVRVRIEDGSFEIAPELWRIDVDALECRQIGSVLAPVVLGAGTGEVDQTLSLEPALAHARHLWLVEPLARGFASDRVPQDARGWAEFVDALFAEETSALVRYVAGRVRSTTGSNVLPGNDAQRYELCVAVERALQPLSVLRAARDDEGLARELFPDRLPPSTLAPALAGARARQALVRELAGWITDDGVTLHAAGRTWSRVAGFERSGPRDAHFALDRARARIAFGNGIDGELVPATAEIRLLRARTCRGAAGNVESAHRWTVDHELTRGVEFENLRAARGGADRESIPELVARMRAALRSLRRVVTVDDVERAARETPGLRVARAWARFGERTGPLSEDDIPGDVLVTVVPAARVEDLARPSRDVSAGFLATVERHLESLRLLGDRLRVRAPSYVEIGVHCTLVVADGVETEEVRRRAVAAIDRLLAPLASGSPGVDHGWPLGEAVRAWELRALLDDLEEVEYVESLSLRRDGESAELDAVELEEHELPWPNDHRVEIQTLRIDRGWSAEGRR